MVFIKAPDDKNYADFVSEWIGALHSHTKRLKNALDGNMSEKELDALVKELQGHYEQYYRAKKSAVRQDVLRMMSPDWETDLEKSLMWVGGFRPSLIFHMLYAQAGQQLEAELAEILQGIDTPSLAALSSAQMVRINELQIRVNEEEKKIGRRMDQIQDGMVNEPFLSLAKLQAEDDAEDLPMIDAVDHMLKQMEEIVVDADQLRKYALFEIVSILSTYQAAQFLVAAAQIQIALREVGERKMAQKLEKLEHKKE